MSESSSSFKKLSTRESGVRAAALQRKPRWASARRIAIINLIVLASFALVAVGLAQQKKRDVQAPAATAFSPEEAAHLEAVITTDLGVIRFKFFPDKAPKHVEQFIKRAREGFYDGSAFHRVFARAIIQGGDPLLKDSKTSRDLWGAGGLNQLQDEFSDLKHERGTVSAVRIPDKANSGGAQFFISASPQPQIDGQYSAFGEVVEGLEVVDRISSVPTDDKNLAITPVKIVSIKIEPEKVEPFKDATPDQMRKDVLLRTSLGEITVEMDPGFAPEHVRNFLKLVETGWYDHTAFHRVVPGFVIQGGIGSTREGDRPHPADRWVRRLKAEFSPGNHIRGTLSMARASDPDSAQTSFFLVLGPVPHLDGKYTIFGKVIDGFDTLDRIEKVERNGETPVERIELIEAAIKP
ncbi:MAG: peptidylprolyl isomerase [Blastocatellia bacterium]|nr:peptidylprolyl isomerase [Blastocatellia bacterium]